MDRRERERESHMLQTNRKCKIFHPAPPCGNKDTGKYFGLLPVLEYMVRRGGEVERRKCKLKLRCLYTKSKCNK